MHTTHHTRTTAEWIALLAEQNALIADLSHDPGFGVPTAAFTRRQIDRLPAGRVGIAVGDIKNLKQWNSATGSQERTDELFRPALHVRDTDVLILGKRDSGDQFILVATRARAVAERINTDLRDADTSAAERAAYTRGVCIKKYGPWIGRIAAAAGILSDTAYPAIDWQVVDDVDVSDIHAAASAAERRLFGDKAARLTFGILLKGARA